MNMLTVKCINNINPITDEVEKEIQIGEAYEVSSIDMGQSRTYVVLVGIDNWFNSVYFEFFEDGEPINIFNDERYNPYLSIFYYKWCLNGKIGRHASFKRKCLVCVGLSLINSTLNYFK